MPDLNLTGETIAYCILTVLIIEFVFPAQIYLFSSRKNKANFNAVFDYRPSELLIKLFFYVLLFYFFSRPEYGGAASLLSMFMVLVNTLYVYKVKWKLACDQA